MLLTHYHRRICVRLPLFMLQAWQFAPQQRAVGNAAKCWWRIINTFCHSMIALLGFYAFMAICLLQQTFMCNCLYVWVFLCIYVSCSCMQSELHFKNVYCSVLVAVVCYWYFLLFLFFSTMATTIYARIHCLTVSTRSKNFVRTIVAFARVALK